MNHRSSLYNRLFYATLLLVAAVLIWLKVGGGWSQLFIHGDGLGYYAYLPASFIYEDSAYEFGWFNEVYHRYYGPGLFENPEDNFMVDYHGRRINKYYQGLSFLWLPFFALAHLFAKLTGVAADGFSAPYQLAIGAASLGYLLLGLTFLRRLLLLLFRDQLAALLVPVSVIFGSHLFSFAFHVNSHTHAYSFTFMVMFLYFLSAFRAGDNRSSAFFWWSVFAFLITVCIRPLNGLILLAVPAFAGLSALRSLRTLKITLPHVAIITLSGALLCYQLYIMWSQTGSVLAYTYTDERFYFSRSRFFDALISYHMGLFIYVPLFFAGLFGIPFLPKKMRIILPGVFFLLVYIYASWWFWPIVKRGMIDFYVIPAIWCGALFSSLRGITGRSASVLLAVLCVAWYQFRHYQISVGALDEWQTTREDFHRNFWRTTRAQMYHVPAASVLQRSEHHEDFEGNQDGVVRGQGSVSGEGALLLDRNNYIAKVCEAEYPAFFKGTAGMKKVRLSFEALFRDHVEAFHIFLQIKSGDGKTIREIPFYINKEQLWFDGWDLSQYGCEIQEEWLEGESPRKVEVVAWNVASSGKIYLDDVKLEFFLTDHSFETFK